MATNKASQICGISLALGTLILVACGGETTENVTNISQMGMDVVSSVGDLPKCSADNEGELAFVKGETSARICVDGKWFATKEAVSDTVVLAGDTVLVSKIDTLVLAGDTVFLAGGKDTVLVSKIDTLFIEGSDLSCETKPLADSSGLKILCNGDSIGVVLNGAAGKDGEPGEKGEDGVGKDGVGCSLAQAGTKITITCGENSATIDMGEGGGIAVDTAALDSEKIAISLDEVSGVTQKGPFLSGSKVLVREMEDGRTLTQTGNSFNGKILNDKGEFKINARMLVSQYVMLEATGYYRNEVTGENSNSPLTLFGITDVTTRNIVNINLLTHLEYERVIYLVTKKKMKVLEAKKQAQQEVFGLLGINSTGFSNSEDLNIAGSSDEDGALLAFSILFQGDRSVSQLTELLTRVSTDMEKDGVWDNSTAKMGIAEWAADADSSGKLAQIRTNVKNWNLSTMVPKFEPFVRHFWYKEYGLGDCTESRINEVAAATAGKRVGTKTRYICKDTDGLGDMRWVIASDIEKDTMGWGAGAFDGEVQVGQINTSIYYIYETSKNSWRYATTLEKDTYQKACSEDGTLFSGNVTDTVYVCDNGKFRVANSTEKLWNRGCVSYIFGSSEMFDGQYSYYKCSAKGWEYDFENLNIGTLTYGGKTYKTIGIKTQVWMAENLAFEYKVDGASYGNSCNTDNCETYGRYYSWAAAMDSAGVNSTNGKGCGYDFENPKPCSPSYPVQGICPEGWHLPSRSEWEKLYSAMGRKPYAMQAKGYANWSSATDAYGFSALPAGSDYFEGVSHFLYVGSEAQFWSATEFNAGSAYVWFLNASEAGISTDALNPHISVRCVKD